ncbi:UDP-N-acetylglucosamine diphosphorylase 1 [Hibiscus syriacus]|uniref:UDP-N-acetylglucosamine diphosphorylase n=1 Tax=Hibiscus syriacus TaxID=106335 RepID=A0A6A2XY21_HIBSY|nr:UDP-N-acetylglucosamine diphosphorylase 1 [Hibiscus syriacus]
MVGVDGNVAAAAGDDGSALPPPSSSPPQALIERLKDYGQEHVFALWDELSPQERLHFVDDIQGLDLSRTDRIIRCSLRSQGLPVAAMEPVPKSCVSSVEERAMEERERWWKMGLKAISEGKLAVLLLGTRLGSSDPKGCFSEYFLITAGMVLKILCCIQASSDDAFHLIFGVEQDMFREYIGLPSGKSLFQLQAKRILCVQKLAAQAKNEAGSAGSVTIHWYIMTSPFTDDATPKFFENHKYFGLEADQVIFFQQGTKPCISKDGRYIMETPFKVRAADPIFLGYFIDKGAYPQEKVGVFVRRGKGGPLTVVEYGELNSSLASAINQQTGRLRFCWSNVCLHMFTLDFLSQVAVGLEKDSVYHVAEKKIPFINGYTMGLKLEQFVFDAFPLFEVLREEEFAPVKNANGSNYDTPDSARLLLLQLHSRWVATAGGFLTHSVPLYAAGVEVSLLCSYAGENLESICRVRTFHAPCEIAF